MELYIGANIKRLRQQKGITQETLAERMHVSAAAVSKWERGETVPDIGMVIPLATYFGVSTDELLGLDAAKMEEKIQAIIEERNRLSALGKSHEAFDLIVNAYKEFPNDWRIIEHYMWKLVYDPNCEDPYGDEVHKEELYRLCERVMDECTPRVLHLVSQPRDHEEHRLNQILDSRHPILDGLVVAEYAPIKGSAVRFVPLTFHGNGDHALVNGRLYE